MTSLERRFVGIRSGDRFLFGIIFAATMVYMVGLNLSSLQLVLVGTVTEGAILVFEIPTGIVADRKSRKLSVLIGFTITGFAFALMGSVPRFGAVAIGSGLWGLGHTFRSGAFDAWIVDEIGQARAEPVFARIGRNGALFSVLGTIIGVVLGSLRIWIPIVVGGLGFFILTAATFWVLPETSFSGIAAPSVRQSLVSIGKDGWRAVRQSSILIALIIVTIVLGAYSEGYDRLRDAHLIRNVGLPSPLPPVVWIGAIGIIGSLLAAVGNNVLEKRISSISRPGIRLGIATLCLAGLIIAFALSVSFPVAVVIVVGVTVIRGVSAPLLNVWINRHTRSEVRATVLSFYGQADAVGQVSFGPIAGAIGNVAGIPIALCVAAAVLIPAAVLYAGTARHN